MLDYAQENDYILQCISNDGYEDTPLKTEKDALLFCWRTFCSEYAWRVDQVGLHKAVTDWLSGLCSACTIAFYNFEILELAEKWGRLKPNASEKQKDAYLEKWFPFMAMRLIGLWRRAGINVGAHKNNV